MLEKESAPPLVNSTGLLTLSEDTKDTDISIDIDKMEEEAFSANKTQILSTKGADDIDINGFPPQGVTVVITNESIIATTAPTRLDFTDTIYSALRAEMARTVDEMSNGTLSIDIPPYTNRTVNLLALATAAEAIPEAQASSSSSSESSMGNYTFSMADIIAKNQSMIENCDDSNSIKKKPATIIVDTVHDKVERFCYDY